MKNLNKNSTKKILLTEANEIAQEAIKMLQLSGYEVVESSLKIDREEIQGLFVRTYTKVTQEYLAQFPSLAFILIAGVGLDNVDLGECKKRNILVFNAPGSNANAVAEYVIAVMLVSLRKLPTQMQLLKEGKWREKDYIGEELQGKTIGLVGCGAIGRLIATKLKNFNVNIIGYDPYVTDEALRALSVKKCTLSYLIKNSDIISLQLPLTSETKNMFSMDKFSQMKKESLFINVSRGELVNEKDLIVALEKKAIAGAVLDVFINEPSINKELLQVENLISTPHVAGFTQNSDLQMAKYAVRNFLNKEAVL